ncbi:hypothetical protein V5O48_004992 [Marasmius crinis-equi]|uniref:F-box domain-containing protein n=1 Tax=Marasmius crinis-equi TaxID=585013 RepID=A0ABR3FNZ4_9AGAR
MDIDVELPRSNRSLPQLSRLWRGAVTSHDRQIIERYLRDAENDMGNYEAEISKLKATILTLEAIQTGLRKTMGKYKALLAPIHRLPSEVLLEIFVRHCEQNSLGGYDCKYLPAACTVSSVCGRWREIAIAAPRLWSSFTIDFGAWSLYHGVEGTQKAADLTRLFLHRSKTAPLDIRILLDVRAGFDCQPTLELIYAASERWYKFQTHFSEIVAESLTGHLELPNLQHLTLRTRLLMGTPRNTILNQFAYCPLLSSVSLDLAGGAANRVHLPWSQLRDMELLDGCPAAPAFSVIPWCPQLCRLILIDVDNDQQPYQGPRVVSHTIRSLSMQSARGGSEANITLAKHLTFPALSSLEIINGWERMLPTRRPEEETHLKEFISRSGCSITSLRLQAVSLTDEEVLRLLRLIPMLKSLAIGEYLHEPTNRIITHSFSEQLFIDQETSADASHALLPLLTELRLSIHANGLDEQALLDALTSRLTPSSKCLSTVNIALIAKEKPLAGPLSLLQCFRHVGLCFNLSHTSVD